MNVTGNEHVIALCESQRDGSHTRHAMARILEAAERRGATTDLVDYASVVSYPEASAARVAPGAD